MWHSVLLVLKIILWNFIRVVPCIKLLSFLWLIFHVIYLALFVYLFIHWWVFGFFHLLVMVIVLLWTCIYIDLFKYLFSILRDTSHGVVEFLGHTVSLCLIFWGTTKLFSTLLNHFPLSAAIYEGSAFSTSSPTFVIFHFLNYSHYHGCEMILLCIFDLPYLNA